jgi:hypothetical protein
MPPEGGLPAEIKRLEKRLIDALETRSKPPVRKMVGGSPRTTILRDRAAV